MDLLKYVKKDKENKSIEEPKIEIIEEEKPKRENKKESLSSKKSNKVLHLEQKIKDLEIELNGLRNDNSQLVTENCNAILFLKKKGFTEKELEEIFPFSRLWEDDFLMNQIEAVDFPLIKKEEKN